MEELSQRTLPFKIKFFKKIGKLRNEKMRKSDLKLYKDDLQHRINEINCHRVNQVKIIIQPRRKNKKLQSKSDTYAPTYTYITTQGTKQGTIVTDEMTSMEKLLVKMFQSKKNYNVKRKKDKK